MSASGELFNSIWGNLTKSLDTELTSKWRNTISTMYNEPQRHYHTLAHVEEMLALRNIHIEKLEDVDAVDYAIIFHDIVYNPKEPDNEEQSTALFKDFAKETKLANTLLEDKVTEMILATQQHSTAEHNSDSGGTGDIHYLLDFDMAVLGRPSYAYKEYADQIRKEYIHIPEKIFCDKRAKVLTSFLQVAYIFATKQFRDSVEAQARMNIKEEIVDLRAKSTKLQ